MCGSDCTDLSWGRITLFYSDDYGGGSDCGVCGDDIVINSNNSLLTSNDVLCEPEWLVFLHFSWFIVVFIKYNKSMDK